MKPEDGMTNISQRISPKFIYDKQDLHEKYFAVAVHEVRRHLRLRGGLSRPHHHLARHLRQGQPSGTGDKI